MVGWGRGWVAVAARAGAAAAVLLAVGVAAVAAQEEAATVSGRVVAATTGAAVEGAGIALARLRDGVVDSLRAETVTDRAGMFQFGGVGAGGYELTVDHIAYGTFRERVTLAPGDRIALRVTLSAAAIVLEPLEIEAMSDETRDARGLGWARRSLTSAELAPVERSGEHLANALARLMPGIRVRSGRSRPGQILCIEFRDPTTLIGGGCRAPLVIVDNVRQADGLVTLNTLPIANIQSIEALSPGEAGVRYGADSGNGVILIETVTAALGRPRAGPTATRVYDWSLEPEPYPWARNLGTAVAANAVGLLAGYALSRPCLSYETLSLHVTAAQCGLAANTGSRLAIYAAPQIGVGYLTARVGATDLSPRQHVAQRDGGDHRGGAGDRAGVDRRRRRLHRLRPRSGSSWRWWARRSRRCWPIGGSAARGEGPWARGRGAHSTAGAPRPVAPPREVTAPPGHTRAPPGTRRAAPCRGVPPGSQARYLVSAVLDDRAPFHDGSAGVARPSVTVQRKRAKSCL